MKPTISIGASSLTIEDIVEVANGRAALVLDTEGDVKARIDRSAKHVSEWCEQNKRVYGIHTGFGASCENEIENASQHELARNLVAYHGCGTGALLSAEAGMAVVTTRLASLCAGYSGVRSEVITRLLHMVEHAYPPVIPSEGSVGASGDLTPLSYVAGALMGQRNVYWRGQITASSEVLASFDLPSLELLPKESLAIMNGTSVMGALMCLGWARAERLAKTASYLTAVAADVLQSQSAHFDERLFLAKPHAGTVQVASWIRQGLGVQARPKINGGKLQDVYSIRCAPHIIGALVDALEFSRTAIETEINGASDNPLVDVETGDSLHGGNFYGGHIAMTADLLKTQVANIADLLERQLVLLNSPHTNRGLPENLVAPSTPHRKANHGFKAMEITASALTAEALKLTMPASVFSRSTEGHNQDKVSMGTIAARDCLRVLELVERVLAIHSIALCQAIDLREGKANSPASTHLLTQIRAHVPATLTDRPMDVAIAKIESILPHDSFLPANILR